MEPTVGMTAGAVEQLRRVHRAAQDLTAGFGVWAAALPAAELREALVQIETTARLLAYLQIAAAAAVQAQNLAGQDPAPARISAGSDAAREADAVIPPGSGEQAQGSAGREIFGWDVPAGKRSTYRNTAEYLQGTLGISIRDARQRLRSGDALVPSLTLTGERLEPRYPVLGNAASLGMIAGDSLQLSLRALQDASSHAPAQVLEAMEDSLASNGIERDPDFLARLAARWRNRIDQDGPEPSVEELGARQGVHLKGQRRGLYHVEIAADQFQYETMLTVFNAGTNPRTAAPGSGNGPCTGQASKGGACNVPEEDAATRSLLDQGANTVPGAGSGSLAGVRVDGRSRPQRMLDALVAACSAALAVEALPQAGGIRPQLIMTITSAELLAQVAERTRAGARRLAGAAVGFAGAGAGAGFGPRPGPGSVFGSAPVAAGAANSQTATATATASATAPGYGSAGSGWMQFTGPACGLGITALACEADTTTVLFASNGQVLDLGRTTRLFTAAQRRALIARDRGCTFPGCSIPASWCEAHHRVYWAAGGRTAVENGVLLCGHHHRLIHQGDWHIVAIDGRPWFLPPPWIDPTRKPQLNHFHHP